MIIRRLLPTLILLLTSCKMAIGQSTAVSATITDSGGQAWINGSYTFTTAALGQTPITGTLDASGAFTSITFPHNSFTSAVGDVWTAKICPDATSPCFTKAVTISGATQSLSSTLIPAAISLTLPPYPAAISTVRAYADAEIVSTPKGGQYFNTVSGVQRQCTTVSGSTCSVWASAGGFSSPMTTLGDLIAEDATPTPVRVPGPTSPNGVPQIFTDTPSGGLAALPAWALPGIVERDVTGTTATDTIASADCSPKAIFYQGSVAVAVTLPTATTLGVANCVFSLTNNTSGSSTAVTVTPTTWTVAPGGASLAIAQGQSCRFSVDSAVATQWDADCHDQPIVAGTGITITRGQYGPTVASSGGGGFIAYGTGGGTANAQTVTTTPNITSLVAGQTQVCWLPVADNTGVPTLAVDGLTAKTVVNQAGGALGGHDLSTTTWACAIYDGTNFELFNPTAGHQLSASGVAAALTGGSSITIQALNTGAVSIGDQNANYLSINGASGVQQRVPSRAIGTVPTLSGTGACATTSTQTGGSWAGSGKCTGTTGAATLTITFAVASANGYICTVWDETTPADTLQQTSHTTTTCVLSAALMAQNDIFVFTAVGF